MSERETESEGVNGLAVTAQVVGIVTGVLSILNLFWIWQLRKEEIEMRRAAQLRGSWPTIH